MKICICKESPCAREMEEYRAILTAGTALYYAKEDDRRVSLPELMKNEDLHKTIERNLRDEL